MLAVVASAAGAELAAAWASAVEGMILPTITNNTAHIAAQDTAEIAANIFADLEDRTIRIFSISRLLDSTRRGDFHSAPPELMPQRNSKATTTPGTPHLQLS
jgi:hypothetical protein